MSKIDDEVARIARRTHQNNMASPVTSTFCDVVIDPKQEPKRILHPYTYTDTTPGWHLYVLTNNMGKYYVGITTDFHRRIKSHHGVSPGGSKWVRSWTEIRVCRVEPLNTTKKWLAEHLEDLETVKMIEMFGLDFVRGGRFTSRRIHPKKYARLLKRVEAIAV